MPWYVRGDARAYTEGTSIFWRRGIDQHSIQGISDIAHELTHVRQEARYPFTYAGRYLEEAARAAAKGGDPAGRGNAFEKEAYDLEDAVRKNLENRFGATNPCP